MAEFVTLVKNQQHFYTQGCKMLQEPHLRGSYMRMHYISTSSYCTNLLIISCLLCHLLLLQLTSLHNLFCSGVHFCPEYLACFWGQTNMHTTWFITGTQAKINYIELAWRRYFWYIAQEVCWTTLEVSFVKIDRLALKTDLWWFYSWN